MYYNDEEDDYREYEEREKRETRTLPDFYIEPTAKCGVCKKQNSSQHPLDWVCSECGEPTHTECGRDCEPSGGWDRDYDMNYWVCANCVEKAKKKLKQHITKEQLTELSPTAQQRLATWFDESMCSDDDLVRAYIPEERDGEFGGVFSGNWDSEHEFDYPEPYIGKLKNHQGTILPLLNIGQMVEMVAGSDVVMTVGVSPQICDDLWNVVKVLLEK